MPDCRHRAISVRSPPDSHATTRSSDGGRQRGAHMTVPEGATRSEDGHYWWDGSAWQAVEAVASANPQALIDGATNEAGRRLEMIRDDITDTVASFSSMAHDDVEDMHGKP